MQELGALVRVYLAVNGLGLGHIVRCQVLAEQLSASGADVLFSTYLDGLEFAIRKKLRVVAAIPIFYQVRGDGSVDLKATSAKIGFSLGLNRFLHQLVQEIQNIRRYAPDVVLVDSRLSSLLAAKLLGKRTALVLNQYRIRLLHKGSNPGTRLSDRVFLLIARLGWTFFGALISEIWGLSDRVIVPDLPPPLTISEHNLAIPKRYVRKVTFVGPITNQPLRSEVAQDILKRKYGFEPKKRLVYAAISGPKHEREPLVHKLMPVLADLSEDFNIVVSQGNPMGENSPKHVGHMCVYEWMENQDDLLHACDMLICRAGHSTILKAMMLGKPLLLVPTPFQTEQLGNADRARSIGAAVVLEQATLSNDSLRESVNLIMSAHEYWNRASQIASQAQTLIADNECTKIISELVGRGAKEDT